MITFSDFLEQILLYYEQEQHVTTNHKVNSYIPFSLFLGFCIHLIDLLTS